MYHFDTGIDAKLIVRLDCVQIIGRISKRENILGVHMIHGFVRDVQCFLICYKQIFDVAIFEMMENTFVKRKRVISHVVCSLEKFPPSLGTNLFHMSERMLE
jgi:hypothetical protein